MFGLAIGIFFFEEDFQIATDAQVDDEYKLVKVPIVTIPYSTSWENTDDVAGLFKNNGKFYNITHQKIENDTIYLTLKTNLSARDRFLELADQITNETEEDLSQSTPLRKAIHSLLDLTKIYSMSEAQITPEFTDLFITAFTSGYNKNSFFLSPCLALFAPPPES